MIISYNILNNKGKIIYFFSKEGFLLFRVSRGLFLKKRDKTFFKIFRAKKPSKKIEKSGEEEDQATEQENILRVPFF